MGGGKGISAPAPPRWGHPDAIYTLGQKQTSPVLPWHRQRHRSSSWDGDDHIPSRGGIKRERAPKPQPSRSLYPKAPPASLEEWQIHRGDPSATPRRWPCTPLDGSGKVSPSSTLLARSPVGPSGLASWRSSKQKAFITGWDWLTSIFR